MLRHSYEMCSKMNAMFVFSATILCLGFIISGCHSMQLGSPNLIEIVEEWGCYDTEIRLTCGHLDSKIAILEATFTPNCTQEQCIKGDLKRLLRGHSASKIVNSRSAETEAGRKFLETLRNNDKMPNAELVEANEPIAESAIPQADSLIGTKEKRTSLRVSLERLIVKYLRQISPRENFEGNRRRSERYRRELAAALSSPSSEESRTDRVVIATRNITIEDREMQDRAETSDERYHRIYDSRGFCPEQSRKIGSLGRMEIDAVVRKKDEDARQNIRKILNKRCSGKNHCSFLFAADDPLAVLWDSGIVHLKYICMDDYHANHYCNEHLTIGNDFGPKRRQVQPEKGEPQAEARIQPRDQSFHSLKILKTNDDDSEPVPTIEENSSFERKSERIRQQKHKKKDQGIYSQDFKVLKILPSNIDDFNDIEELGDEIYFRTNENEGETVFPSVLIPTALTLTSEPSSNKSSSLLSENIQPTSAGNSNNLDMPDTNSDMFLNETRNDLSKFENITLIIREGEQYIVTFPKPRILDNFKINESTTTTSTTSFPTSTTSTTTATTTTVPTSTIPPTTTSPTTTATTTTIVTTSTSTTEDSPVAAASYVTSVENTTEPSYFSRISSSSEQVKDNEQDIEIVATVGSQYLPMESSSREYTTIVTKEFYDSSYDDDDSSEDGYYSGRRQYTSIQRTYYGRPKPQGFTMTPGYPKFYIGDCECKWKILAPVSQKIRITILDISLRYDPVCKDFLKIVDLASKQTLFNSCTEPNSPIEILSSSNQVEVVVKATTKFAYPKRGVLLHYSALGCLTPSPPLYGRLVHRTDFEATFECESLYVFPDTAVNRRQLACTDQHIWDRSLPDCIEEDAITGSGIVSGLNFNLYKTPQSATSAKMGHSEVDTVFDIVIPTILIVGLFAVNAVIFLIIMKHRKRSSSDQ